MGTGGRRRCLGAALTPTHRRSRAAAALQVHRDPAPLGSRARLEPPRRAVNGVLLTAHAPPPAGHTRQCDRPRGLADDRGAVPPRRRECCSSQAGRCLQRASDFGQGPV
eukprot:3282097-Prymnesium_polylepis.1